MVNCNNNAPPINSYSDITNFFKNPSIYKNITIGNGSSSISLNVGDKITFRASNTVTINGSFCVPSGNGTELHIILKPCY
jgi:hypothetical protein